MNELIILVLTGAGVGFMSSFFGIGGGVLMIPILFFLYPNVPAHALIPISLGMIFLNTGLNIYNWRKSIVLPSSKTCIFLFVGCFIGAKSGSFSLYWIDSDLIKKIFASVLLIVSARMLLTTPSETQSQEKLKPVFFLIIGCSGSFLSALTGLGGGVIYIPLFITLTKLKKSSISPYSNVSMFFATFIGIIPHLYKPLEVRSIEMDPLMKTLYVGHVNIVIILVMLAGAALTSKIGSKLNLIVPAKRKNIILAIILLSLSLRIFIQ